MASWSLEAEISAGDVVVYVGMDPDTLNEENYIWSTAGSAGETATLRVRQTDPSFHLGVTYFVYLQSTSAVNVILNLGLKQQRVTYYLGNNNDYTYTLKHPVFNYWTLRQKFTFQTTQERVKFHAFQVEGGAGLRPSYHRTRIIIESLTPNLYPIIYLKQALEDTDASARLGELDYPSRPSHLLAFGESPYEQLGKSVQVYEFYGRATAEYTYYTMAVYQENWGLTDDLKSSYQILVAVESIEQAEYAEGTSEATGNAAAIAVARPVQAASAAEEHEQDEEAVHGLTANTQGGWFFDMQWE